MATNLVKRSFSGGVRALPFCNLQSGMDLKIQTNVPSNAWYGQGAVGGKYTVRLSYQICRAFLELLFGSVSVGKIIGSEDYHIEVRGSLFNVIMRTNQTNKSVKYVLIDKNGSLLGQQQAEDSLFPKSTSQTTGQQTQKGFYWALLLPYLVKSGIMKEDRVNEMRQYIISAQSTTLPDIDVYWSNDAVYQTGKEAKEYINQECLDFDATIYSKPVNVDDETRLFSVVQNGFFEYAGVSGVQQQPQSAAQPAQSSATTQTQSAAPRRVTRLSPVSAAEFAKNVDKYQLVDLSEVDVDDQALIPNKNLSEMKFSDELIDVCECVKERFGSRNPLHNILFFGETGAGKSTLIAMAAQIWGLPYDYTDFNFNSEESDLIGEYLPDGNGGWLFCSPAFIERYTKGGVIELVEFDYAKQGTLGFLNSALDDKQTIKLKSGKTIRRHKNCIIAASINVTYEGCQLLNKALKNRFQEYIPVKKLSDDDIVELIAIFTGDHTQKALYKKLVDIASKAQKFANENGIDGIVSIRNLQEWAWKSLFRGDPALAAETTLLPGLTFDPDEQKSIRDAMIKNAFR